MKMEYNLGTRGGICGGRVEVERATQRKSSRNLYRIPLSPQLNTKLQMCGMKLHNYQRAVRCEMNSSRYMWLGDIQVLTSQSGKNLLNTYAAFVGAIRKGKP